VAFYRLSGVVLAVALAAGGCWRGGEGGSVSEVFPVATITVSGEEWLVAVAADPDLRRRGLTGVDDLGDLRGMLFVFPETVETAFTMRDTLMPIDIAFFDGDGRLVDQLSMVPCAAAPCPSYRSAAPFRFAVETEDGGFDGLEPLVVDVASLP
jgi:uncharacterized membrane protein (UPF0127 family)